MDMETLITIVKTLAALLIVLALAYVTLRNGKSLLAKDNGFIGLVEKVPLSNNAFLAVARIGKDYHLISVNSGETKILKDLDGEEVSAVLEDKMKLMQKNPLEGLINRRRNSE